MKLCHLLTTWIVLEGIMLTEISQSERDKYSVITYMWNLKHETNQYSKTETDSPVQRTDWWLPVRRTMVGRGRMGLGD